MELRILCLSMWEEGVSFHDGRKKSQRELRGKNENQELLDGELRWKLSTGLFSLKN